MVIRKIYVGYGGGEHGIFEGIVEEEDDLALLTDVAPGSKFFVLEDETENVKKSDGSWHKLGQLAQDAADE